MAKCKFSLSSTIVVLLLFLVNVSSAQMVGPDAYIKGTSVEVGIAGAGGFEGAPTSSSPPLPGMHFRSGNPYFGFVSNPQVNAWATFDGDFFTPGSPENGWGFQIGTTGSAGSIQQGNNCSSLYQIPGAITNWSHTFSCYSCDWEGNATSGTDLHFKINYFLQQTDLYYTTTVSITNNTGATIPDMYYYRNLDPDNDESISGDFTTTNKIVNQPFTGSCNTAHVSATSVLPSSQPMSYIGLAAVGANWRADYGGFANRSASDLWYGTGFTQTVGSSAFVDQAIALAYRIQNLAPGATATFKFVVILDDLSAANAINNSTYLSYPGSLTAPPAVCTPYADTVKICAGVPATIGVSGPSVSSFNWSWTPTTGLTPATGPTVSANPATTTSYTVTGTPTTPCFTPITMAFVVKVTPGVVVNPVSNITTCPGATVPASAYTSTPTGATYTWTNSNTAIGLAASGSGNTPAFTATNTTGAPITSTISVTPTLPGGCTGTPLTYTITVSPPPTITVNSATICPGQTATLTAAGGTTYLWNTGSTANPLSVSPATTTSYTVTGTTAGCSGTAVATVTVGGSIAITVNSPTICAGTSATLTATGGATYAWNTGSTANPLTVAPAVTTSYTVTGTSGGCSGTAVSTVTVNPNPATTVPANITVCDGATVPASVFASTPTGGTFAWTNSNTAIGLTTSGTGNTPSFVATNTTGAPITSTISVTSTLAGCTGPANTYTITVNPTPVITVNSPTICPSSTATLTAAGGSTYLWNTGSTANPLSVTPAVNTTYTVTGTTAAGCSSTAVSTVTISSGLVVNAGADDTICFGASTVLNATPNGAGYTYSWTPATGLSSTSVYNPTANPAATTTYTVTITNPSGCTGTDDVTIYADPQITVAKTAFNITCNGACNGQTIVIPGGGAGGFSYLWSSSCTTASCTGLCPGTYSVTVTDAWGCTALADTSVTEPSVLTASITSTTATTCNGACDGSATAAGAGGTAGYTYSWNTVPAQTTVTATALCAGTYICTVTDANSCTTTTTATITEPALVVISPITAATVCSGGSTTLTAAATGGNPGGYNYTWAPTGTGTTASVTVSPAATITYTVSATDVLHSCPSAPVTVTVTVNPPLSVVATGTASICPGGSTPLNATGSNGNGGPYTYSWLPTTGLSSAAIANPVASPTVTTTYTVTANDGCSPAATATVTVTVLPLPNDGFTVDNVSGCAPLCVNFTDTSTVTGGAIASWAWTFGDGTTNSTQNPSHCFINPGSYNITLTVASSLGGCTSTSTYSNYITVYPIPIAGVNAPVSASIINPVVNFTDNSTNAASWNWNFGDINASGTDNTSTLQNPSHTYSQVGNYCGTLAVKSANGCTDTIPFCIEITPEFTFYIPNAFSPNGDGINDEFFGKGDYVQQFEMDIFDRWGNLIFYTDDMNKHWDGTINHGSDIAQQDTYVYVVKITDGKSQKHKYIGSVTIVK